VGRFVDLVTGDAVRAARLRWDGVDRYPASGATGPDRLGAAEVAFVAGRDGFYLASVTESGWPYVQFRGGPRGFLRAVDDHTLAFSDLRGNRQHVTAGNVARDDRVALFLMDYRNRRRLKILGRCAVLATPGGEGPRELRIAVEAFDWNCPQHIPLRVDVEELAAVEARVAALRARIAALEAENAELRAGRSGGVR
jgi:uncharacterized protein